MGATITRLWIESAMFDLVAEPYYFPDAVARVAWLGRKAAQEEPNESPALEDVISEVAPNAPAALIEALKSAYIAGYWSVKNSYPATKH